MAADGLAHLTSGQLTAALAEDGSDTLEWSRRISLLIIDVDRFGEIAAAVGDVGGERVLAEIAGRLRDVLRPNQMLARLEADEFAVVLPGAGREVAERVAQDLVARLDEPLLVAVDGRETLVPVRVSVGSATSQPPREDPGRLIGEATIALSVAKAAGGGISHFDPDLPRPELTRPRSELAVALEQDELEVFLQPQVDLITGRVRGVEALVRWRHPRDGVLLPASFLPLAARTGLLRPVASVVLDLAVAACTGWWSAGHQVPVSVNLTPTDLLDEALTAGITARLAAVGLPPEALCVEVTEEIFLAETGRVADLLREWRGQGVAVALDDFGTGYSSLAYLRELPVGELKLDRVFVADLARPTTATIVRHTIAMAHDLGMTVVAEGVEDDATAATLRDLGCDIGQGLHFGGAMPPADFLAYLTGVHPEPLARP